MTRRSYVWIILVIAALGSCVALLFLNRSGSVPEKTIPAAQSRPPDSSSKQTAYPKAVRPSIRSLPIEVRVINLAGDEVVDAQISLRRPGKRAYWTSTGSWASESYGRGPQPGHELTAYARGCDPKKYVLTDEKKYIIRLSPCVETAMVQLDSEITSLTGVHLHIGLGIVDHGISDSIPVTVELRTGSTVTIPIPSGIEAIRTSLYVDHPSSRLLCPWVSAIAPGVTVRVFEKELQPHTLITNVPRGSAWETTAIVPEYSEFRSSGPARNVAIDYIRRNVISVTWTGDSLSTSKIPDVPFHVFGRLGGRRIYLYVSPSHLPIDLADLKLETLPAIAPATWSVPGRVGANALFLLRRLRIESYANQPVLVAPDCDSTTAFSESTGIMYRSLRGEETPRTHTSTVNVRWPVDFAGSSPQVTIWEDVGYRVVTGHLGVAWVGTNDLNNQCTVFRGVPPGKYLARFAPLSGSSKISTKEVRRFTVTKGQPHTQTLVWEHASAILRSR